MGRFTLPIQQICLALVLILWGASPQVFAVDKEIDPSYLYEDVSYPLQASALRTATIFSIKVYRVGFYAERKDLQLRPLIISVNYLRDFSAEDVDEAWKYQFEESSDYPYPELSKHVTMIQDFFAAIENQRQHSFVLLNDKTLVYENSKFKGEIVGKEFQQNFIYLWIGKNPPTKEVKKKLLQGLKP